ncbi:MAG: hypothetical protein CBD26_03090 [Candidatus Pelagibacter sp. TMED166]|nr:MAG: hypothetical protein CBD26_03090 [Candidatus Pelagibacter sp. TMED166]|tara:strand:+ start:13663 stop:14289 length:627 start_codon:yes stop_codon:yes gene_type:complete
MNKNCVVKTLVANLYSEPSFKSELVTQALINENLKILETQDNWYKVKQWDNYISWIHKFYTSTKAEDLSNSWSNLDSKIKDVNSMISYANSFLGTPYLWGGKSALGFDCSGFVQTVFKMCGIYLSRDASEQIKNKNLVKIDYNDINSGDLIFFAKDNIIDHVSIYLGNGKIIHSSGSVKVENLEDNKDLYDKLYGVMSTKGLFNERIS